MSDTQVFIKDTELITEILEQNLNGERDDDSMLYISLCYRLGIDLTKVSAMEMLKETERYPKFDSVSRIRRMLQYEHSYLRGEVYRERLNYRQKLAKHEIKDAQFDERGQTYMELQ